MTTGFKFGLTLLAVMAVVTFVIWLNQDEGPGGASDDLSAESLRGASDNAHLNAGGPPGGADESGGEVKLAPGATGSGNSLVGARTPHGMDYSDPDVRASELKRLIGLQDWLAASRIVALMEEPIPAELRPAILFELRNGRRNQILHIFSKLLDASFVEDLFDVLDDPEAPSGARRTALAALWQMPGAPADTVALRLEGRLTNNLREDRAVLFAIAARGGQEAARAMVEYVQRSESPASIPRNILQQLDFEKDPDAAEFLMSALQTEKSDKALTALILMASKPGARSFTDVLIALDAPGRSTAVREQSLRALSAIGDEKGIGYLLDKAGQPGTLGEKATRAIGAIGSADPKARERLRNALESADRSPRPEEMKQSILLAIGCVGDREALPAVASELDDRSALVRIAAVRAMGRLGPKAQDYVPKLARIFDQSDATTQVTVAIALADIGGERAILEMERILEQDGLSPTLQRTLTHGLRRAKNALPGGKAK